MVIIIYCAVALGNIAFRINEYQWDFRTYYYAAKSLQSGLDPYSTEDLSSLSGSEIRLPYTYPPATLWLFSPFTFIPYEYSSRVWLLLKIVALIALVVIWKRVFLQESLEASLLVFSLVAFHAALYLDLASGNISVFEQLGIWLALLCLVRSRLTLFCILIVWVSFIKIAPIVFLSLPIVMKTRNAVKCAVISFVAFSALIAANYIAMPDLFGSFARTISSIDERGISNACTYAFIMDSADILEEKNLIHLPATVPLIAYFSLAIAILGVALARFRAGFVRDQRPDIMASISLFALTYALIMPRLKSYSYVLLIPVGYYVLRRHIHSEVVYYLLLVLMGLIAFAAGPLPLSASLKELLLPYQALLFAAFLWAVMILLEPPVADGSRSIAPLR